MNINIAERNGAIDFLRAFMVLYVIGFAHLLPYTSIPVYIYDNWQVQAITKVVLGTFVLLSGWLLAQWKDELNWRGVASFYRRRLLRIYPLYVCALLLFLLTWLASPNDVVRAALLLSMFYPPPPSTLWFITMIMVFYCIAPLLLYPIVKGASFACFSLVIFAIFLIFDRWINPIDVRIVTFYPEFVIGILMRRSIIYSKYLAKHKLILLIPASILCLILTRTNTGSPIIDALLAIPWVVVGSLLLWELASQYCAKIGMHCMIQRISYSSYTAYLFHRVFFLFAMRFYWPSESYLQAMYLLLGIVPIILINSWIIQFTYNKFIYALSNTFR